MATLNTPKVLGSIKSIVYKHSPEILTGLGIVGMITSTIMAVKATPKAIEKIKAQEVEKQDKLTKVEVVKATWKCYIPAAVTSATSVACLVGASSVNVRRNAALATAYSLSKTALTEYKDKVVETIGDKKETAIRESIAKDKLEKDPVSNREVIVTERGSTLCYDGLFGRYFRSDIDSIKRAVNRINRDVVVDMYVSLNDFYHEIGLGPVAIGDNLGWNIDDGEISVEFSSQLADDGTPCLVIEYNVAPRYGYSKFF